MPDLLFEIGTEELPSWYVEQGRQGLHEGVVRRLASASIAHGEVRSYATPRRLAVVVQDVAAHAERRTETRRGPSASAAFDADGRPTRAALGFASSIGVDPAALRTVNTDKGAYVYADVAVGGEATIELLSPLLAATVVDLPAPRKMRWGDGDVAFVRPVAWLLATFGGTPVHVSVGPYRSGTTTRGHRFEAPGEIAIASAGEYVDALRAARVLVDPAERRRATVEAVEQVAAEHGVVPVWDEALLDEVCDLVEWPTAIVGRFDPRYLALPAEVLSTVMIHHQRFVPTTDQRGVFENRFVAVSNTAVPDPSVVCKGYESVLDGRLYDARFFWDADRAKRLSQHAWALSGIAFQKGLGSMADKVTRIGDTAPRIAEALGTPSDVVATLLGALPFHRADLATEMVGELPELEGIMARCYAIEEGLDRSVAEVLEDGVRPSTPGGPLPSTLAGAILAASDRADKILGFFALGKRPTGSADPFGLRRDATALARIVSSAGFDLSLRELFQHAATSLSDVDVEVTQDVVDDAEAFTFDRVSSALADEAVSVPVIRAALGGHPSVITVARRAHALTAMLSTADVEPLLAAYKRAANLASTASPALTPDRTKLEGPLEWALFDALEPARRSMEALWSEVETTLTPWPVGDGTTASIDLSVPLAGVLALKAPLDAFLDGVMVMVDDPNLRAHRLALLRETRDILARLGDLDALVG